jgi:hypothetical protein
MKNQLKEMGDVLETNLLCFQACRAEKFSSLAPKAES